MKKVISIILALICLLSSGVFTIANAEGLPAGVTMEEEIKYRWGGNFYYNSDKKQYDYTRVEGVFFLYEEKLIPVNSERYKTALALFEDVLNRKKSYTLDKDNKPGPFEFGAKCFMLALNGAEVGMDYYVIYDDGTVVPVEYPANDFMCVGTGNQQDMRYVVRGKEVTPPDPYWYFCRYCFFHDQNSEVSYRQDEWPEKYKTKDDTATSTTKPTQPSNPSTNDPKTEEPQDNTSNNGNTGFFASFLAIFNSIIQFFKNLFSK